MRIVDAMVVVGLSFALRTCENTQRHKGVDARRMVLEVDSVDRDFFFFDARVIFTNSKRITRF
jgi:hypothetical protein